MMFSLCCCDGSLCLECKRLSAEFSGSTDMTYVSRWVRLTIIGAWSGGLE